MYAQFYILYIDSSSPISTTVLLVAISVLISLVVIITAMVLISICCYLKLKGRLFSNIQIETPPPVLFDNIAYGMNNSGLASMIYDTVLPEQVSDTTLVTSSIHSNIIHNSSLQDYNNPVIPLEEPEHTIMSRENLIPMTQVDRTYETIPDIASQSNGIDDQTRPDSDTTLTLYVTPNEFEGVSPVLPVELNTNIAYNSVIKKTSDYLSVL